MVLLQLKFRAKRIALMGPATAPPRNASVSVRKTAAPYVRANRNAAARQPARPTAKRRIAVVPGKKYVANASLMEKASVEWAIAETPRLPRDPIDVEKILSFHKI